MWYISFHGGSDGVNNIQVYHNSGKPHSSPNILPVGGTNPELSELRAFYRVGELLYVVNGYKNYSQVLVYLSDGDGGYTFKEVFASKDKVEGIFHPYDLTFDTTGNCFVSSQDTNVVTGLKGVNDPMPIASYLEHKYPSTGNFLLGTQVASSVGALPDNPTPSPQDVPTPQGLDVNYTDDSDTKIAHSVRGVMCFNDYLFVADEPANEVKIYALATGELYGQIKGDNLVSPVQLLINDETLYIGSSGNDSVVTCDLRNGVSKGSVAPTTFIDGKVKHISGMAFDDDGNFYAAERKAQKIKMFPADGSGDGETVIDDLPDNPEFIMYVPKGS
jgi:hypothetical protein